MRGKRIDELLKPIAEVSAQFHLGNGLHTLGLLGWILSQTGKADVYVSTFSTSDEFCSGFWRLRKKNLIGNAVLVADLKASRKTVQLYSLMQRCFDSVFLAHNHSKVVLVKNERHMVTVITSQNQTYGDRAECTVVTSDPLAYEAVLKGLRDLIDKSVQLNGIFERRSERDRADGHEPDDACGDCGPDGMGRDGVSG